MLISDCNILSVRIIKVQTLYHGFYSSKIKNIFSLQLHTKTCNTIIHFNDHPEIVQHPKPKRNHWNSRACNLHTIPISTTIIKLTQLKSEKIELAVANNLPTKWTESIFYNWNFCAMSACKQILFNLSRLGESQREYCSEVNKTVIRSWIAGD